MKTDRHRQIQAVLWIVFYLILMDISVNIFLPFPKDPEGTPPSFLQEYFEYGRSVEGKLERMARMQDSKPVSLLGYGWLQDKSYELLPRRVPENQILVAVYGMSHAKLLGEAIELLSSKYVIRYINAPGAPPQWSFAAYEEDKEYHEAKVVIMGIMTDSIPYLTATAGATAFFDMSHPYTFPRYFVEDDILKQIYPPFFTRKGFREYFYDKNKWGDYRAWLAENDKFYDAFLFKRSLTDKSALLRVLRRAYSEMFKQKRIRDVYRSEGFKLNSEEVITLRALVREFSRTAKKMKSVPIVYIVNNEGRGNHLFKVLEPALDAERIPYLSTHIICPPDDPRVYTGVNSHFTPEKDKELAKEIIKIIERELNEDAIPQRIRP